MRQEFEGPALRPRAIAMTNGRGTRSRRAVLLERFNLELVGTASHHCQFVTAPWQLASATGGSARMRKS